MCGGGGVDPNEGKGGEREGFWNDLDRIVDRVGNWYILCVMGDLNGYIGVRVRAGITDVFGVPGENENERRVMEFCAERGCVWARVAKGQDEVEVKSMTDLVLVKKDMLCFVQDVRAMRGME